MSEATSAPSSNEPAADIDSLLPTSLLDTKSEVTADVSSSSATSSSSFPSLKLKKVRKRNVFKSSTTPLEDEKQEAEAEAEAANGGTTDTLQAIRQIQELRSKKASALTLGETDLHVPSSAAGSTAAASSSSAASSSGAPIAKEFGGEAKDTQAMLIEEQMEKYITEKLAARKASRLPQQSEAASSSSSSSSAPSKPALNLSEDQLFVTPAHLQVASRPLAEAEESGERWLTGISEMPITIKDKMTNIEKTERARMEFLEKEAKKRQAEAGLVLPANYNANFRLHKKDWDSRRRDEVRNFIDLQNRTQAVAQGLPTPAPVFRDRPTSVQSQMSALPGFLAGGIEEQREQARQAAFRLGSGPSENANAAPGTRGSGMRAATDQQAVDRFVKRFKFK